MHWQGVAGLVLGAGASTRMGSETNKLTAMVEGKPLIVWPIDALIGAGVDPVFVVTGHEAAAVRLAIGANTEAVCHFVHHTAWEEGMGSSIARGVQGLMQKCEPSGLLVSVGDLPGLRSEWVVPLIEAFDRAASPHCICVPTHRGRAGHPVLFGAHHLPALAGLSGDRGARSLIEAAGSHVHEVEIESPGILLDVDTPADLEERAGHET